MRFKSGGDLDDLIREFDRMNNTIDDNVDEVLHDNAVKFSTDTVKTAKEVMNKGYWTGNLARMVEDAKEGHLKYGITSKAGYSGNGIPYVGNSIVNNRTISGNSLMYWCF